MKTTIMFKTDKKLKEAAQKTAQTMGIPFSAVLNEYMRDFVEKKSITFSAEQYNPTPYLKKLLDRGEKDLALGKVKSYASINELIAEIEK